MQSNQEMMDILLNERAELADALQNDVNQTLASVLLWIEFTKTSKNMTDDPSFLHAEENLRAAINRLREMHYGLVKNIHNSDLV